MRHSASVDVGACHGPDIACLLGEPKADPIAIRRPTSLLIGQASVQMFRGEGLAHRLVRAGIDPLPPRAVMSSVFPSGDQLAKSSGPSSAIVIQALSAIGFGPSMGAIAIRPRFDSV